jgi:hypothetical protein
MGILAQITTIFFIAFERAKRKDNEHRGFAVINKILISQSFNLH